MTAEHLPTTDSPEQHPKRRGVRAIVQEAMTAVRRSEDMNRVRMARLGLWQGEPALVVPSSRAQGPMDNSGMINVGNLTNEELRFAVTHQILSREVLLVADQERLDQTPSTDDLSVMGSLYEKITEDLKTYSPEKPNYP